MKQNKLKQILGTVVCSILLLALPFFEEIYYRPLYYFLLIIVILHAIHRIVYDTKYEEQFYDKWQKKREQGFWINVAREGVRSFVQMFIFVLLGQFFGNGRNPFDIFCRLTGSMLSWLFVFLLGLNFVLGILAWNENEKRYARIHLEKMKE